MRLVRSARHGGTLLLAAMLCCVCASASADAADVPTPPGRKVVYLTFDDGPGEKTQELLEVLKRERVQATFFLVGTAVEQFPEQARAIRDAGHALGCHGYHHARKHLTTDTRFYFEMRRFNKAIREAFGRPIYIRLFRFPYGSSWASEATRRMVAEFDYLWIDWNALNGDADSGIGRDVNRMLATAISSSGTQDEIVLLMHNGKARTIEMLPDLLQYYRQAGYAFDVLTPELDHLIENVHMGLPNGKMQ